MALTNTVKARSLIDAVTPSINQVYVPLSNGENVLIAAAAGRQIQITGIFLSSDTAGVFVLKTTSSVMFPFVLAANSNFSEYASGRDDALFGGNIGEDINMTVSGSPTDAGIYLQYRSR